MDRGIPQTHAHIHTAVGNQPDEKVAVATRIIDESCEKSILTICILIG